MRLSSFTSPAVAAAAVAVAAVVLPPPSVGAATPPLASEVRPGPAVLHASLADAPQLDNAPGSVWHAPSIRVSGAEAYRDHEFLYQDFLYDDHGANGGLPDPTDPRREPGGNASAGNLFSLPNGTYTYPTDPVYGNNAADLVEFRVRPLADATAFRITLNTLHDPQRVATTIVIGTSPTSVPLPHGANTSAPGRLFLTVHGHTADLLDAVGHPVGPASVSVRVDLRRRQIEVRLPHADWDPGRATVRLAAAVGLWDTAHDRYLIPQTRADTTHPGGAGALVAPSAFFNVAFRTHEPLPDVSQPLTFAADPAWWRDHDQGHALRAGDLSPFHAEVDFAKLADGVDDVSGVPRVGVMDRILASHTETEQGADWSVACSTAGPCAGELRGRLQPYAIYVPPTPPPASGYGLTLLLHSLGANYNQFSGSRNQSQFAQRGPGAIVITPEARGPDGWYYDQAEADVFEVWADVAAHYPLDTGWVDVAGYSMGGYGTYKLAARYPDLFARAQPTVGPPALGIWVPPAPPSGGDASNTYAMLASLRHVPFLMWVEASDELVPYPGTFTQAQGFDTLGYRYVFDTFTLGDHLTLAFDDQYQPAADFLGTARVVRDPAHVTYVVNPTMDFPAAGLVADHAYWLSGLRLRDAHASSLGSIDVRSQGFGLADPPALPTATGAGVLVGGNLPALPYVERSRQWGAPSSAPMADRLDIVARNVSAVTVDIARARVDCNATLHVDSDGPLTVTLAGCGTITVAGGVRGITGVTALPVTARLGNDDGAAAVAGGGVLGAAVVAHRRRRRRP